MICLKKYKLDSLSIFSINAKLLYRIQNELSELKSFIPDSVMSKGIIEKFDKLDNLLNHMDRYMDIVGDVIATHKMLIEEKENDFVTETDEKGDIYVNV